MADESSPRADQPSPDASDDRVHVEDRGEPIIEVKDLVVRYDEQVVLNGVSMSVHRGEVMVILGGSGSAKSTLPKCLLGIPKPVPGSVTVLGVDMVWFGVMIGLNLQTSFLTPPFGFSLFYLRGVTPKSIPTTAIYRGVMPFIGIQLLGLLLIIVFPGLVTGLIS